VRKSRSRRYTGPTRRVPIEISLRGRYVHPWFPRRLLIWRLATGQEFAGSFLLAYRHDNLQAPQDAIVFNLEDVRNIPARGCNVCRCPGFRFPAPYT